jgi:crotonobetainyl-CoA:carnitine CoA-transferase CaiB-like acyl-CoA transferase
MEAVALTDTGTDQLGANLGGLRVIELADEQAEYCGQLLAGLGADVIKVEPPGGSPTRRIGPFYEDIEDPERSLYFWQYNRGKRSIVIDLSSEGGTGRLLDLIAKADVVLDSTPRRQLDGLGLGGADLIARFPGLIVARMSPFGDTGPWADYLGSDLVHLALGGPMMNSGYDPQPGGYYDLPPIAPQMWHAYHIAGEQLAMGILAALVYRRRTGRGQQLSCAVHEAVSKNTELDLMNWVMRRAPLFRQTCRHAAEVPSLVPGIAQTKDGRWFMMTALGAKDRTKLVNFLGRYGMAGDLPDRLADSGGLKPEVNARLIPGSGADSEMNAHVQEVVQRWVRKYTYANMPWRDAQEAGLLCVPLRKPHENTTDEHWVKRATFSEVDHPELGRSFTYATSKWVSPEAPWRIGRRAPLLDEDGPSVVAELAAEPARSFVASVPASADRLSRWGKPFALQGVRILDFTWFLASAGGTRFLAALGAESIKVEWAAHPDTRMGAMAPVGGRAVREKATSPVPGVTDSDMGGQFNNKNSGKRGISLNVRHPRGLEIARELVRMSDIVAEGFSPGVMNGWGLGYDELRALKPDVIYAQQSGMGSAGTYGRFRAVGPIAASIAGTSEMSRLPEPAMPAGWGYSYLDWIGAYSFATAMLAALEYRDRTGRGQWIDASQCETGIFISGTSVLDWSAHGRSFAGYGNRSPYKPAAPHGAYRCIGADRWIAIACFTDAQWKALVEVADHFEWLDDPRFGTLEARLANQDDLDDLVTEWAGKQDAYDLMARLQGAGVAAGVCQTAEDRCDRDPQLAELGWLTEVTGTKIGTWPVAEVPVSMSATPPFIGGTVDRGAPCYGEDNEYVYGELLGLSTAEIGTLADEGVI